MEVIIFTRKQAEKVIRESIRDFVYSPIKTTIKWLDPHDDKRVAGECFGPFFVGMPFEADTEIAPLRGHPDYTHIVAIGVIGCHISPTNPETMMWSNKGDPEIISGEISLRWLTEYDDR